MKNAAAIALMLLTACSQAPAPQPAAVQERPNHAIELLSINCDHNHGRARAELAFLNTGSTTIEYAKATVRFSNGISDAYLDPRPLRPGGTATVLTYAPSKGSDGSCSLVNVQDANGWPVNVSMK